MLKPFPFGGLLTQLKKNAMKTRKEKKIENRFAKLLFASVIIYFIFSNL
tara:strand:+ start:2113 stop:2259 length:147 start_codon:yes stop_codon:yes gene_type:complete